MPLLGPKYFIVLGTKEEAAFHHEVIAVLSCSMHQGIVLQWTLPSWPCNHLKKHRERSPEQIQKKKYTLVGPLILSLVQRTLKSLSWHEGVQAVSIPMSSSFEVRIDVLHMWGIVPQVKEMYEGLDGHHIHPGRVA